MSAFGWLRSLWQKAFAAPAAIAASGNGGGGGGGFVDAHRRLREPTPRDLLDELKGTAWACATINASVCASHPPKLYVATGPGQPEPKCLQRPLSAVQRKALTVAPGSDGWGNGAQVAEVTEHPLLDLFRSVNPIMNSFDLWELTTLYQEVTGTAYWLLERGPPFGLPVAIWPLPTHRVRPVRARASQQLVDHYELEAAGGRQQLDPADVICFVYPDPRDPYGAGAGPLRACFEQVKVASEYSAFKLSKFANHAIPDAMLSPKEVIGEEEARRLEMQWHQKMRRGGAGRVIVAESEMKLDLLQHSMGDAAALADHRATKDDIATAFGVPLPFLSSDTNLANLQAAGTLHGTLAIRPRLRRRDEKLNERLLPLYDPTGRLRLISPDPVPEDRDFKLREETQLLSAGVITVAEARAARGLPPLPEAPAREGESSADFTDDEAEALEEVEAKGFVRGLNFHRANPRKPSRLPVDRNGQPTGIGLRGKPTIGAQKARLAWLLRQEKTGLAATVALMKRQSGGGQGYLAEELSRWLIGQMDRPPGAGGEGPHPVPSFIRGAPGLNHRLTSHGQSDAWRKLNAGLVALRVARREANLVNKQNLEKLVVATIESLRSPIGREEEEP